MAERIFAGAALALMLGACSSTVPPSTIGRGPAGPAAGAYGNPRELMGVDARRLVQMFGQPRLDIRERTMRKLQFANGRCVLDAYLYAPAKGREPVVTHVDSRLPNGTDTDPTACAAILQKR